MYVVYFGECLLEWIHILGYWLGDVGDSQFLSPLSSLSLVFYQFASPIPPQTNLTPKNYQAYAAYITYITWSNDIIAKVTCKPTARHFHFQ